MLAVLALAVLAATPSGAATNATKAKDAAPSCVVRLTDDGPASPALNCLYLLFDPERELDFDAARSARNQARYELNTKTTPNFGYAAARLWTRLEVVNASNSIDDFVLEYTYPSMQSIRLFVIGADGSIQKFVTGKRYPFAQRPIAHHNFAFPLRIPRGERALLYIEFETTSALQVPLTIETQAQFGQKTQDTYLWYGIYYGFLLLMFVSNLFIYASTWDRNYLLYTLYVISVVVLQMSLHGVAYQKFWPEAVAWNMKSTIVFVGATFAELGVFTMSFLETRRHTPRMHVILAVFTACAVSVFVLAFVAYGNLVVRMAGWLTSIQPLIMVPTAILCLKGARRPATFYLIAIVFYMLGACLYGLKDGGLLPSVFITENGIVLGSALEMGLFSLGLADKIKRLQIQRKALEARAARSHAIAQTTQMLAHDVRKPFTLLRALLDLLSGATTFQEMKETVEGVRIELNAATQAVDEMIQDVMEMGSSAVLETGAVEVVDVVRSTLDHFFRRPTRHYDVTIRWSLEHAHKLQVHRAKVERVLLNIIGNALEAMHGRGELRFRSREVQRRGKSFVELTIGNTNSFIHHDNLKKLFEPFFTSGKKGGTGLGLAIAQKIVEAHGGDIFCRSSHADGVDFVFTLPASSEASTDGGAVLPGSAADMALDGDSLKLGGLTLQQTAERPPVVVLVEDVPAIQKAWRLRIPGPELAVFDTPEAFLDAAHADRLLLDGPRFFVLDQRFPAHCMHGLDLAEHLRKQVQGRILLCSTQRLDPLPSVFDASLVKRAYDLSELEALAASLSVKDSVPSGSTASRHVVLVDDSRAIQRAWRRRMPDGTLLVFGSPTDLLASAESRPAILTDAEAVILDNNFGDDMLGEDLARLIRPRTRAPILMASDEVSSIVPCDVDARISKNALSLDELRQILLSVLTRNSFKQPSSPQTQASTRYRGPS